MYQVACRHEEVIRMYRVCLLHVTNSVLSFACRSVSTLAACTSGSRAVVKARAHIARTLGDLVEIGALTINIRTVTALSEQSGLCTDIWLHSCHLIDTIASIIFRYYAAACRTLDLSFVVS